MRRVPASASPRHEQLLDQLTALFLAEGFAQFTLSDIAKRLRCSKSTLYALGHSKERVTVVAVLRFFQTATTHVEARAAAETEPDARIAAYLGAVADELRLASESFIDDVARHPAARAVYERNTRLAAERVRAMIADGVATGAFREVHGAFVADTVAATMARIQSGEVDARTGLSDAQAYDELASLVLNGIRSERSHAAIRRERRSALRATVGGSPTRRAT